MKILVVDDHVLIRYALRGVLKQLRGDASILEASDCGQTMRLIEQHPDLDLIVLDLNLPDRDGFSVLAELRERYATTANWLSTSARWALFRRRPIVRSCSMPFS